MNKNPKVFIVHCVDTEGPLHEELGATFSRIKSICGIELEVSKDTLHKLQQKKINLQGKEDEVYELIKPHRIKLNKTWGQVKEMVDMISNKEYRQEFRDSYGQPWKFSWFILDHHGFFGSNPRKRDLNDHAVFDFYTKHDNVISQGDHIGWHYHPLPTNGNVHCSGTTAVNSNNIHTVLCKKLIDRLWFPSSFRPGFHAERPDLSLFLEQWIPFDYGNQSIAENKKSNFVHADLAGSRFGDWRKAPVQWSPYHPSFRDYQLSGSSHRWITRCLNIEARLRNIDDQDIEDAFLEAEKKGSSILAFTDHDFRDMDYDIRKMYSMISKVKKRFKNISTVNANAIEAIRENLNIENKRITLEADLIKNSSTHSKLFIKTKELPFNIQPFFAIKTKDGRYEWKSLDSEDNLVWSFTFDWNDIYIEDCESFAIACTSYSGKIELLKYNCAEEEWIRRVID